MSACDGCSEYWASEGKVARPKLLAWRKSELQQGRYFFSACGSLTSKKKRHRVSLPMPLSLHPTHALHAAR